MTIDLAIIGAGPAGMAAAIEAADLGLSVAVIDENPAPGGQVFRGVERAGGDPALGADYAEGLALARAFRAAPIAWHPATTLWHLDPEEGYLSLDGAPDLSARRVLLATGAQERPVPILGWTLPGVMTAGAAQILLKTAGVVPAGRTVLAGQGPLLPLLAAQYRRAGAPPALILETTPRGRRRAALAALAAGGLWAGRHLLWKGLGLLAETRAIPRRRGVTGLRAEGRNRVERVVWEGGSAACDTLLLHEGVIPATHIPMALGLEMSWDAAQRCWRPVTDAYGASSHPNVAVAGDGAGIGGWEAAVAAGHLAALDAAQRLGRLSAEERDRRARPWLALRRRALALRPFLDALYAPAPASIPDATIACRCEEVTAGQVRAAARLGATGPNQMKAYLRCGMGPCQGRLCGPTVAALIAEARGTTEAAVGLYRPRAPYKPITVGTLARL
ncbi:NAD(P)/FAD-dependent oxidoreductase [Siccirubricoccus sp. KC 17139]|uniref:NAD(P)/FAD-dependent oxidoreductase n=1 Tax=Siccirubricoccus soli TaxID=2899147 RepID=A0ABT1D960_9PROT|nr:NAD(P)/FAD-dependent oxidoreductase [Siccirubricoccus soli]MCO6418477.1 NAD(P)/FAD-dependent oxidoreductase [Siccirubricoccus soli]MCP2684612.1 NAD(P)/FAD-dependent oxidoreductase [Siccirubricoccus soli]